MNEHAKPPRPPVRVRPLEPGEEERWDRYVGRHPDGALFQTIAWRQVIESTFPYRPHYLVAQREGRIRGVLPLFRVKNPFTRAQLVSVPMGVYGGVVADDGEAQAALLDGARSLAARCRAGCVELRQVRALPQPGLRPGGGYATFVKELPRDPDECLALLPRKARAAARKAIGQYALEARFGQDRLDVFYHLFALNKRHLGSPIYPRSLFERLLDRLGERAGILIVRAGGRDVAGVLTFFYKDTVIPYYSGSDVAFEHMQINNFLYLRLMEHGIRAGYRYFDFGRSRVGSGSYRFKKHQGFEATPLHYQVLLTGASAIPDRTPDNPRFGLARRVWRHLPLFVVKGLGPRLIRYFP